MTLQPPAQGSPTDRLENPWAIQSVTIRDVIPEIDNVKTFRLALDNEEAANGYQFSPGQFNMLYLPGVGESAISMSGDSADCRVLDHTIRVAGNVTTGICNLQVGDTLGLRGPFGKGWPMDECAKKDVILVTGGIGLPPLRPVLFELIRRREEFGEVNLLYGARSPESLLYGNEYQAWTESGINVHLTVDRSAPGWQGSVGVVTLLLERLETFDPSNTILLCCGPEIMMRFVSRTAVERGIQTSQIWVSTERNMNCAIGLCGHCQLGGTFVCKDGPVIRYDQIEPYLMVQGL